MRTRSSLLGLLAVVLVPLAACGAPPEPAGGNAASAGGGSTAQCPPAGGAAVRTTEFAAPPPMCIDPAKAYTATVATDAGDFTIDLDAQAAPQTVNNFVVLARHRFYDGTTFHRVIKGFMNQGGDPEGTGRGGPGYTIPDELPADGAYEVGSVAMANTGRPDTGGSQFFVVTGPTGTSLPPMYAVFGRVASGMETVKAIEADGADGDGPPAVVHRIESVTVAER